MVFTETTRQCGSFMKLSYELLKVLTKYGDVIFGCESGSVVALDSEYGAEKWRYESEEEIFYGLSISQSILAERFTSETVPVFTKHKTKTEL